MAMIASKGCFEPCWPTSLFCCCCSLWGLEVGKLVRSVVLPPRRSVAALTRDPLPPGIMLDCVCEAVYILCTARGSS